NQDRPPAVPIRQIAERRSGGQLAEREHRKQQTDDDRRRPERLGVERQERNDDSEPHQVDEDCQEDDEEWARHDVQTFYTVKRAEETAGQRTIAERIFSLRSLATRLRV